MELSNPFHYCSCAKILLVDDEPFNLIVLEGLFSQLGIYEIDKAFNGAEALDKILANEEGRTQCAEH